MTYKIRLGGTSEFVSKIDPFYNLCAPPGIVEFVEGWTNPSALVYETYEGAIEAADKVLDIEGFHTTVEEVK